MVGLSFRRTVFGSVIKRARPEFFIVQNANVVAGLAEDEQPFFIGETINPLVDAHSGNSAIQNRAAKGGKEIKKTRQLLLQEIFDVGLPQPQLDFDQDGAIRRQTDDVGFHIVAVEMPFEVGVKRVQLDAALVEKTFDRGQNSLLGEPAQ